MTVFLGDRGGFAVEVGEWAGPALRRVDLWAAGQWLTCDDDTAFVPQFRIAVADTADRLRTGHGAAAPFAGLSAAAAHRRLIAGSGQEEQDDVLRRRSQFFDRWGPTTDNLMAFAFRDGDRLELTWQFWREEHLRSHPEHVGVVFVLDIQATEMTSILDELLAALDRRDVS
ncbi:hypothetical protein [Actinospica robiniae]|uniref:hypothetical protein n=1 Tax=Actinospica robiniae TaxID=304901 RepID=UPI0005558DD8|nr:hypothetical protein [Actinospica robiniae]